MKNRPFATVFCCFLLFFAISHSAVNYPYPQKKSYGNGTINVNTTSPDPYTTLKSKFTDFLSTHYTTGTCPGNKQCARIRWDETDKTVSEGIGYGMLMMVYFSDASTSYQSNFDLLWAYYQSFLNERGLMRWKINGFSSYIEENAASDAEFDVATALVMAHYQFGSTSSKNYLDTAKALIAKIRQQEISPNNLHKPGDVWDEVRNPSYISPAAFEIFREVEGLSTSKAKWESVITANYTLLEANQNSNGLFSDWCTDAGAASDNKGSTSSPSGYSYDSARVPCRVAWANAWYGHQSAKDLLTKVNTY
jgi:endo-1,4-beta-D-glucanase Y